MGIAIAALWCGSAADAGAAPSLSAPTSFNVGDAPTAVAIGDLNGDGRADVVAANPGIVTVKAVTVLLNTSSAGATTPSFTTTDFAVDHRPNSVALADVDGDGKRDIVMPLSQGNAGADLVAVLVNATADNATTAAFAIGSGLTSVALADLSADGRTEVVAPDLTGNLFTLHNTTPTGASLATFASAVGWPVATAGGGTRQPWDVAAGDVNGDAKPDVTVALRNNGQVSILLKTGQPVLSAPATMSFGTQAPGTVGSPQELSLSNSGDAALHLVRLRFAPAATGERSATVTVSSDAPDSPRTVTLSGTGVVPPSDGGGTGTPPGGDPTGTPSGGDQTGTDTTTKPAVKRLICLRHTTSRDGREVVRITCRVALRKPSRFAETRGRLIRRGKTFATGRVSRRGVVTLAPRERRTVPLGNRATPLQASGPRRGLSVGVPERREPVRSRPDAVATPEGLVRAGRALCEIDACRLVLLATALLGLGGCRLPLLRVTPCPRRWR